MASVKGSNFTNITADPVVKTSSQYAHGKLRIQYDSYEASSLASWLRHFSCKITKRRSSV
jgi:hypothetical protein